jgi:hypothetical protein
MGAAVETAIAGRTGRPRCDLLAGMGHGYDGESVDALEVRGAAGVNGEVVRYCRGANHGVIASGDDLAAAAAQRGSDLAAIQPDSTRPAPYQRSDPHLLTVHDAVHDVPAMVGQVWDSNVRHRHAVTRVILGQTRLSARG